METKRMPRPNKPFTTCSKKGKYLSIYICQSLTVIPFQLLVCSSNVLDILHPALYHIIILLITMLLHKWHEREIILYSGSSVGIQANRNTHNFSNILVSNQCSSATENTLATTATTLFWHCSFSLSHVVFRTFANLVIAHSVSFHIF